MQMRNDAANEFDKVKPIAMLRCMAARGENNDGQPISEHGGFRVLRQIVARHRFEWHWLRSRCCHAGMIL
jgi:hypothetical protein